MNEGNDRTVLDIVSDLIDDLVKYCYEQINNYEHRTDGLTPLPGSPGSEELKDEKYKEYINNAYDIGNLLFTNIGEYLEAFSRSLRTFSLVFPPWALARMIFETSAKVMEFFEANITTEKRCQRTLAFLLESADIHRRLLNSEIRCSGDAPSLVKKLEYANDAKAMGFKVEWKEETPTKIGQGFTDTTKLVENHLVFESPLDDENNKNLGWLSRLCSAVLHGNEWALVRIGYITIAKNADRDNLIKREVNPKYTAIIICFSLIAYHKALISKFDLYGWDHSKIDKSFDETLYLIRGYFGYSTITASDLQD